MFDKELFRCTFIGKHAEVTFTIYSLSGKQIAIAGRRFKYMFNETNDKEMEIIATALDAFYGRIEEELKTSEDEEKLKDFHRLINILNTYTGD